MKPRFLFIRTFYPEFLKSIYAESPDLAGANYESQLRALFDSGFGVGDAYSYELRRLGCDAEEVICNADDLQARWVAEHGAAVSDDPHVRRREIVAAQVAEHSPDVLFVFEWCPLGDAFLARVKRGVRLLAGQIASPVRADRTYAAYDLMLSSYPPLLDYFRTRGLSAEHFRLGFDERVLERLGEVGHRFDVTFVGGVAPSHPDRVEWIEAVGREIPVEVFGYGWECVSAASPAHHRLHGEVWGWEMYRTLASSRITLNRHARIDTGIEQRQSFANNMRLFEATGVGSCLVTEERSNLKSLFEEDREIVTYGSIQECIARVRQLLEDPSRRMAIARAGQERTLAEHTYRHRMAELLEIVRRYL